MVQISTPPLTSVLQELTLGASSLAGDGGGSHASASNESSILAGNTQSVGVSTPITQSPQNFNESPRGESLTSRQIKTTTVGLRKYRAWCFDTEESDVCLGMLGQGSTFCTVRDCRKTHRSNAFHVALPGELYVAKT